MKLLKSKSPHHMVDRMLAIHDDGSISFALAASKLVARHNKKRKHYTLLDYTEKLGLPVLVDGVKMVPHVVVILYCKPSQKDDRKNRLGNIRRMLNARS